MHQPHDKLFKAGFSDPETTARFLRSQLPPALTAAIDWSSLRQEGHQEGHLAGRQEGRQEGHLAGRQEAVLAYLEIRFGPVPQGLVEAMRQVADPARLESLQRTSFTCASIEEFAAAL